MFLYRLTEDVWNLKSERKNAVKKRIELINLYISYTVYQKRISN